MSTAFSHSTRSLQENTNHISQVGFLLAFLMMLAWVIWFTQANIMIHETGQFTGLEQGSKRGNTIVATFPAELAGRIQRGQSAQIQLDERESAIPAVVMNIIEGSKNKPLQVELYLLAEDRASLTLIRSGVSGKVDIVTERISLASLILRNAQSVMNMSTGT